jgi:hypothetical protein
MRREAAAGGRDLARSLDDDFRFHSAFVFRKLGSEFRVVPFQSFDQCFERLPLGRKSIDFKFFPVSPVLYKLGVEAILAEDDHRHRQ